MNGAKTIRFNSLPLATGGEIGLFVFVMYEHLNLTYRMNVIISYYSDKFVLTMLLVTTNEQPTNNNSN